MRAPGLSPQNRQMHSFFSLVLPFVFFSPATFAALSTDAETALSFYRDRNSLFPSGQVSRTTLEARLLRSENEIVFRSRWDKKEFRLEADQIIRDIQVARFVENKDAGAILSAKRSEAPALKKIPAKTTLEILNVDDFWAQVKEPKENIIGWLPLHHLQSRHDDLGYFMNIIDTYLREQPLANGKVITTIPRLHRLIPLEITKSFLKVQYAEHIGYVDITNFISRADFANLAYHPRKGWQRALYRNNNVLLSQAGLTLPLKEILGYVTDSNRGVVVRGHGVLPLRARVNIVKLEANNWGVSRVDGHGEVWWKKKNLLLTTPTPLSASTLTTDELMKRELYSVAFENKNSLKGLVSSEGVYRTEDGVTWTWLPQFGKKNYPVSIHPNGTWFVGSFKSSNRGKSFEPFIRWDHIAQAIESAYHKNPKIMRLTQIEALENSRILIHVDTGSRNIKLRGLIGDIRWDVIKN
ncbi:MAG: hypothetical protein HUU57_05895 [Bdellovibrio sp.]|nr:hypothetical protein [Bdellovibrio sp.]